MSTTRKPNRTLPRSAPQKFKFLTSEQINRLTPHQHAKYEQSLRDHFKGLPKNLNNVNYAKLNSQPIESRLK